MEKDLEMKKMNGEETLLSLREDLQEVVAKGRKVDKLFKKFPCQQLCPTKARHWSVQEGTCAGTWLQIRRNIVEIMIHVTRRKCIGKVLIDLLNTNDITNKDGQPYLSCCGPETCLSGCESSWSPSPEGTYKYLLEQQKWQMKCSCRWPDQDLDNP